MPDNTWFTPYAIPAHKCLSLGPSQGIVYQLSDKTVIKVPFQYPINEKIPQDEAEEKIYMSLRSFAIFKRENSFYDLIAERPHPNIAQRLHNKQPGIILQQFTPLGIAWGHQPKETRSVWIQHLLSALEWLECQGYTHGDLKIQNMGIDDNNRLRLFDFGSIRQHDEEGFDEQVLEDHFWLATCIYFLASGVDPIAKANSSKEVQETLRRLKGGLGTVETTAKEFEEVIQAGWTGALLTTSFSAVRKAVAEIVQKTSSSSEDCRLEDLSTSYPLTYDDDVAIERDLRWMDEEGYRTSCQEMGFPTPADNM